MAALDYVGKANRYIKQVLEGKKPANRFVKLACERQQRDLERAAKKKPRFPVRLRPEKSEPAVRLPGALNARKGREGRRVYTPGGLAVLYCNNGIRLDKPGREARR